MIQRVLLFAAVVLLALAVPAVAQSPFTGSNCTQNGGYPFSQGGCLNASDLNNALELSVGGSPPQNVSGQGASLGKLWLDTSGSPAQLRQCAVQAPGTCSTKYVVTEWVNWEAVDFGAGTVDWPIGGGTASVPAAAVLDVGLYPQSTLTVTGTATISSFGTRLPAGQGKILLFAGASTLIYGASSIVTPTGANITTQAGGIALVVAQGGGIYRLLYQPLAGGGGGGAPPGGSTNAFQFNAGSGSFGGTPVVNSAVACTNGSGVPGECTTLPGGLTYPSPTFTGTAAGGTLQPGTPLAIGFGGTAATTQAGAQAALGIGNLGLLNIPAATPLLGSNGTGLSSVSTGNNVAVSLGVLNVIAGGSSKAIQFAAAGGGLSGTNVANNALVCTDASGNPSECTTTPSGIAIPSPAITGLSNPTTADQPANKGYVDATAVGFFPHTAVAAATAAVLPNSPTYSNGSSGVGATLTSGANAALVVDGLTISTLGTRVLVQTQAAGAQNGIYTLTTAGVPGSVAWVLTRAADFNTAAAGGIAFGANVFVQAGGTANGATSWTMNTTGTITVGTTALNWVQSSGGTSYTADNTSLQLSGTVFSVKPGGTFPTGLIIPGYLTGNQTITITGDASGSGTTTIPLTLGNTMVTPGTYNPVGSLSVNPQGRVTAISPLGYTPLNPANNLSDVGSVSTARSNLGLGSIATLGIPAASNLLGSSGSAFTPVAVSGPGLSLSAGTLTAVPYTADGPTLTLTGRQFSVTSGGIGNPQLASMVAHTHKGNVGSSPAAPSDLTQAQLTADLNPCTATLQGLVPAPPNDATMVLDGVCAWRSLLTLPSLTVTGNLSVGSLTVPAPAESANTVYAGPPSGSAAPASFRPVAPADLAPISSALGPCPSIVLYGGVGDNATDNTSAYNATVTAGGAHPCVSFPGGIFKGTFVSNLPVASQGAITIEGAGIDTTTILPTTSGFTIGLNGIWQSFHIRNLAIVTASACSTCTAISVTQNVANSNPASSGQSDITNVAIYGNDRSASFPSGIDYFETGIELNGVSNINTVNVVVDGVQSSAGPTPGTSRGIYVHGNSSEIPVVINFVNTTVNLYSRGLDIGSYVQGVTWVNGNLTGNMVGIYFSATTGTGNSQFAMTNSAANNCASVFVPQPAGNTVTLNALQLTNNYIIASGQPWSCGSFTTALSLGRGTSYPIITGNNFGGAAGITAIQTSAFSYTGGKIVNNMFNGFGTGIDTTDAATTPAGLLISGNTLTNNTTGIKIGATTVDAIVSNNHMQGNTTDLVDNALLGKNFIDIPQDCSGVPGVGLMFGGSNTGITYSSSPAPACRLVVAAHRAFVDFDYTLTSKGPAPGTATAQFQLPIAPDPSVPTGMGSIAFLGAVSGLTTGAVTAEMSGGLLNLWNGTVNGSTVITNSNFTNASRIKGTAVFQVPSVE